MPWERKDMPKFNPHTFKSTMSSEEMRRINRESRECFYRGERDKAIDMLAKIPLQPHIAMDILLDPELGKEHLLEDNYFNLADAEAFYGKDWIEKYGPKVPAEV